MATKEELLGRATQYCATKGLCVGKRLGFGVHGSVFATKNQGDVDDNWISAVKVHEREADYRRERDVYLRLKEHNIISVMDCEVPRLLGFDDVAFILEMTIVTRPYVLDFGGAFLDFKPDFPDEVMAEWHAEKAEQFGSRWPRAQGILRYLEGFGIYVVDVNPNNISLLD